MSRVVAQAIRNMMDAGLTLEQALLAVEKMDEAKRGSAKSNAERQAEFRARQKAARNAVTSNESNASNVTSVTPSRDIQHAPTHAEPEPNKTTYPTTSEANASSVEPHPVEITLTGETLPPIAKPKPPPSASRGCRLPPGFPGDAEREWFKSEMRLTDDEFTECRDEFRDYWSGVSGRHGSKCDWPATFRNAARKYAARRRPRQAHASGNQRADGGTIGIYQRAAAYVRAAHDVPERRPGLFGDGSGELEMRYRIPAE